MLRAMDSAVAGLRAHQNKLDVIGNNIANVNTLGFKSQSYNFIEAMYQTSSASTGGTAGANATGGTNAAQYGYGSMMGSISMDMTASTPTYVGGFTASIDGEGFFMTLPTLEENLLTTSDAIKNQNYDFTRVGLFIIDANGYMVDSGGNFVYGFRANDPTNSLNGFETQLNALRAPVSITPAVTDADGNVTTAGSGTYAATGSAMLLKDIKINDMGEVTATIQSGTDVNNNDISGTVISLGKVAIATFQNPEGMSKKGGSYYGGTTGDNSGIVSATQPGGTTSDLMTGYVEASNVDLSKEFADMITTQRGFQANAKIITVSDEILAELINMKR